MDFSSLFFNIFIFLLGLIVGSFLNCVIYRLALPNFSFWKNLGGLTSRSYCPKCKHKLSWYDLIPVLSFIVLKGKCRYCGKKISWQYPLVELATGIIFLLIFNFSAFGGPAVGWQFFRLRPLGFGGQAIFNQFSNLNFQIIINLCFLSIVSCFLLIIFVYDLKHYIIPDKVVYPAILLALIFNFQFSWTPAGGLPEGLLFNQFSIFNYSILSAFGAAGFFLLIFLVSKGKWLGFGDVKLAFLMGMFLGFPKIIVALFLAFFFGGIIGIGLIIFKKKNLKSEIPFAPFLITGTFLALFWGQNLINWYLSLII